MPGMQHDAPATPGWHWTEDASAFFGFNEQERKFRDFHAWESQNWLMVGGAHRVTRAVRSGATAMTSLEPFTLKKMRITAGLSNRARRSARRRSSSTTSTRTI